MPPCPESILLGAAALACCRRRRWRWGYGSRHKLLQLGLLDWSRSSSHSTCSEGWLEVGRRRPSWWWCPRQRTSLSEPIWAIETLLGRRISFHWAARSWWFRFSQGVQQVATTPTGAGLAAAASPVPPPQVCSPPPPHRRTHSQPPSTTLRRPPGGPVIDSSPSLSLASAFLSAGEGGRSDSRTRSAQKAGPRT
jgi:hypothetical protein